jgi:putative ABC transport system permease protein
MGSIQGILTSLLGGIASIALLVGGIGIMNMMLTSVSERTREIGLRKALGAEPARIQIQFLTESIILSLMGGTVGIVLGELINFIGSSAIGIDFSISWGAIALGAGFSAAVGIIFGWMPARRASELNPIDALRSE